MDATGEDPTTLCDKYAQLLQSTKVHKRSIEVAKSIWTWIILARRPLTLKELRCAVELDLRTKLIDLRRTLSIICGELVTIDSEYRVNVVHETVRQILLEQKISTECTVDKAHGHARIATTLLKLLSGDCLRQLPINPPAESVSASSFDSSLLDYAANFFAEHISCCPPEEDSVMKELCVFLEFNVLLWIEHVAMSLNLAVIMKVACDLRRYAASRAKVVPKDGSTGIVEQWATELLEVAERFSSQLLVTPGSIRRLIPALRSPNSIIFKASFKNFGSRSQWSDGSPATAVSPGNDFFAIGTSAGDVFIYETATLEQHLTMAHPRSGRVEILQFSPGDENLATFQADSISGQTQVISSDTQYAVSQQSPTCVAFLVTQEATLLAFGSRMHPVLILNLRKQQQLGECIINSNNGIDDMVFDPNPDIALLVVACNDGRMCLFDYKTRALKLTVPDVFAQKLACSSDGSSLFTGDSQGVVKMCGFGHDKVGNTRLLPIYSVDGPEVSI
ncbi:hypothetical protein CCMA1212_004145 [Trichoderma ghanense]|uniref:GPI inositol-deacylase winged helix domain-containing protein n=1 Tax=Trichoderma ghanense TaxID=65468 RepID=A0ABY2H9Z3_9HYPO